MTIGYYVANDVKLINQIYKREKISLTKAKVGYQNIQKFELKSNN